MLKTSQIDGKTAYIAAIPESPLAPYEESARLYTEIQRFLSQNSHKIVHERVFGSKNASEAILKARKEALTPENNKHETPFSFLVASPPQGEGLAGVLIQTVATNDESTGLETIFLDTTPVGYKWTWNDDQYMILHSMGAQNTPRNMSRSQQASDAINQTSNLLKKHGMSFNHVARTWFYLDDILKWYPDFNIVRNHLYNDFGIMPKHNQPHLKLPSSTGINSGNLKGSALAMDLLAIKPANPAEFSIEQLSNPGQKDAFKYGSAFSRGSVIGNNAPHLIQLSGTASIDEKGNSIHIDDIDAQIHCTLDKIETLLSTIDATLDNLTAATVFLKKAKFFENYKSIIQSRGLKDFPGVPVVADVCRDNLLFEIDAEGLL